MCMAFGDLLNKSFKAVWDHKVIWLFGILFSFFNGFGGQGFNSAFNGPGSKSKSISTSVERYLRSLSEDQIVLLIVLLIALVLIMVLVGTFFSLVLRGSLIHLVASVSRDEAIGARGGFSAGLRKVLPLFGKSIVIGLPFMFLVFGLIGFDVLLFVLAFMHGTPAIGVIIALVLFSILLVLLIVAAGVVIMLVSNFSDRFIVIDGTEVLASIRRSYGLFKKHKGQFLIAWLVMVGVGFGFGMVFGVLALIIGTSAIAIAMISPWLILAVAAPGIVILLIPSGFFQAFASAFWTYFFLELPGFDAASEGQELPTEPGAAIT